MNPQTDLTGLEHGVGLLLVQICRAHRNLVAVALEAIRVHVGQEHVVYRLAIQEGTTQSGLAEALCVDASTVTKMVLRLERDGVVERRPDPADARLQRVYLTSRGKTLVQPVIDIWSQAEARLVAGMAETERAMLRRLLVSMVRNLT
ncbi:MAG: MarR family transcriptional regulator [Chloroflexi bacterium]|nr:MarR family transcriptional regulator [Chloroflexota bacterium]